MKLDDFGTLIISAAASPMTLKLAKRVLPLALVLTSVVVQLSEQCMQTPQGQLTSEVIGVGPGGAAEVISVSCACPSGNCGFVLQNDAVTQTSYSNQDITSVGSCACANGQTENCYPANTDPDTTVAGVYSIIDLSCPTPSDFCVCSPTGECFTSILDDSLSDLNFFPYQDAGGCNVYVSPQCFMPGSDDNPNDGLKSTTTATQFTCSDAANNPIVGSTSPYIKVLSASCAGCDVIAGVTATNCGSTSSFAAATPIRKKRDL